MSYSTRIWKDWTQTERRTCLGLSMFALLAIGFLLNDPAVQTVAGAAKALGVLSFVIGSAMSPSFFLAKFSELKRPPRPMRVGLFVFIAFYSVGTGIDLLRGVFEGV